MAGKNICDLLVTWKLFCFVGLHVLGIFRVGGSKKRMKQVI